MEQTTSNSKELRCAAGELRIASREGAPSRTIVGYAAKFERWSDPICGWFREKIDPAAFEDTDMGDVIMCFNHNAGAILARSTSGTLRISTYATGLRFEFDAPDTSLGNDMLELVRRSDISKCSFAFIVDRVEKLEEKVYKLEVVIDRKNIELEENRSVIRQAYLCPTAPENCPVLRKNEELRTVRRERRCAAKNGTENGATL